MGRGGGYARENIGGGEDSFRNILSTGLIPFSYFDVDIVLGPLFPSPSPSLPDSPPTFLFLFLPLPLFLLFQKKKRFEEGEGGKEEKGESIKIFLSGEERIKEYMELCLGYFILQGKEGEQKEKTKMGWDGMV